MRYAIQLDPNSSVAHQRLAFSILGPQGKHEAALLELREAARLDPLSPIIASNIGDEYLRADDYANAENEYKRVIETAPRFAYAHSRLGLTLLKESRLEEGVSQIQKARDLSEDYSSIMADLIYALWTVGSRDEAQKLLSELETRSQREYISNVTLAMAYAGIEWKDRAIEMLQKAVAERSNQVRVNVDEPHFDRIRSDPQFQKVLETIGIKRAN